jgi:hypothetical protein
MSRDIRSFFGGTPSNADSKKPEKTGRGSKKRTILSDEENRTITPPSKRPRDAKPSVINISSEIDSDTETKSKSRKKKRIISSSGNNLTVLI